MKKFMLILLVGFNLHAQINKDFIVATIDSKPVTYEQFENEFNQRFENTADIATITNFFPNFKALAFTAFINDIVLRKWAEKNKIDNINRDVDKSYKNLPNKFKQIDQKDTETGVILKAFLKELKQKINTNDKLAQEFYEKNKFNPIFYEETFLKSYGGLKIQAVKFKKKEYAQEFFNKAQKNGVNFIDLAKKDGKEIDTFGDQPINIKTPKLNLLFKFQLKRIKTIPNIKLTRIGKDYVVVNAYERVAPTFKPFEEIKEEVKKIMVSDQLPQLLKEKIEELKKEYKIDDSAGKRLFESKEF